MYCGYVALGILLVMVDASLTGWASLQLHVIS
jgi:hypothetical protein